MKAEALVAILECRPMLRAKDVCRHLSISKSTLYVWLADPTLDFPRPAHVHGPLWSPAEIEAFLTRRRKAKERTRPAPRTRPAAAAQ